MSTNPPSAPLKNDDPGEAAEDARGMQNLPYWLFGGLALVSLLARLFLISK